MPPYLMNAELFTMKSILCPHFSPKRMGYHQSKTDHDRAITRKTLA
jgi:hypothetical protein